MAEALFIFHLATNSLNFNHPYTFSSSVQLFSCVWLFVTPWTAALGFPVHHQLPELAQTNVHWVGDGLQQAYPVILFSSCLQSCPASVFFNESVLHIRWPKYWSFSFSNCPSNECALRISFRMDGWISLQSKGLLRVFSNTTVQMHQFFGTQLSLWSNSHTHTWLLEKP